MTQVCYFRYYKTCGLCGAFQRGQQVGKVEKLQRELPQQLHVLGSASPGAASPVLGNVGWWLHCILLDLVGNWFLPRSSRVFLYLSLGKVTCFYFSPGYSFCINIIA